MRMLLNIMFYINCLSYAFMAWMLTTATIIFLRKNAVNFTVIPCSLILSKFYYQMMHKKFALKGAVLM